MNLDEAYEEYPEQGDCLKHIAKVRWGERPSCPRCGHRSPSSLPRESRFHCNRCNRSFSPTSGTPFHHSHSDLQKWFVAIWVIYHSRRSVSVRQLSRTIQLNKNTAWKMLRRIKDARGEERALLEKIIKEA